MSSRIVRAVKHSVELCRQRQTNHNKQSKRGKGGIQLGTVPPCTRFPTDQYCNCNLSFCVCVCCPVCCPCLVSQGKYIRRTTRRCRRKTSVGSRERLTGHTTFSCSLFFQLLFRKKTKDQMGKRDELNVVAVCRQGEETHTKAARARDKFFLLSFFFLAQQQQGVHTTLQFKKWVTQKSTKIVLNYFGNHFNFNFEFNRI